MAKRYSINVETFSRCLDMLREGGDLAKQDGIYTPTLSGMRRADGLALWLLDRIA